MNENLDLTKILEECPKGTKFYSKCFGELTLDCITGYTICLKDYQKCSRIYKKNGKYIYCDETAEIDLLPSKDQRDWSKWHIPFKDGDILSYQSDCFKNRSIYIYKYHAKMNTSYYVALSGSPNSNLMINYSKESGALNGYNDTARFATEEEKQLLFDAIKAHSYRWNAKTKTLEKLTEPKFKVGDRIKHKHINKNVCYAEYIIKEVYDSCYKTNCGTMPFELQDDYELVPNKFHPKTLIPFKSKVLVRDGDHFSWVGSIYTHCKENEFYTVNGTYYRQCIPYNDDTAYLIGTYKEAPEYYRYWED